METSGPDLAAAAGEYLQDIRVAQNLVVLRTSPGNASSLAIALDHSELEELVGTVAGDDTVLVITVDNTSAAAFRKRMLDLIAG
jgi:transcriptional regulator of arginine metabolism